jgi:hypothetical protein
MWACFKRCVQRVLPWAGALTVALIVGGLAAIALSSLGTGGLTGAAVGAVVGVAIGADAIGTLLGCLLGCLVSDAPAG